MSKLEISGNSFKKAIEELKLNFIVVDNVTSDKLVKTFVKYEIKPKKIQSQLTNMIVQHIETFNTELFLLLIVYID